MKICQSRFMILPNAKSNLQKLAILLSKWQNFTKTGHTDCPLVFSSPSFDCSFLHCNKKQKITFFLGIEPLTKLNWYQCDQIGQFLKVLGDKICDKSSPNDWQIFGQCWKTSLLCKNFGCYPTFRTTFANRLLFTQTSGHTGECLDRVRGQWICDFRWTLAFKF